MQKSQQVILMLNNAGDLIDVFAKRFLRTHITHRGNALIIIVSTNSKF